MKPTPVPLYWDTLQHQAWTFHLAATDVGLSCVTLPNETWDIVHRWVKRHLPGAVLIHDTDKLRPYMEQIEEYLNEQRTTFSLPLDLRGTPFQMRVWRALLGISFGTTRSYSDIAEIIGQSNAARAVGFANGANPVPIVVPCHRIIGKDGMLTGYRGGVDMKAELLSLEGQKINTAHFTETLH